MSEPKPSVPMTVGETAWSEVRRRNATLGLHEKDLDADPLKQFERWLTEAVAHKLTQPDAMTLATATADGRPSARMVLLKGFDERGFVFYTNYESQKGRELEANPRAALVFYWGELERQVRISGTVSRVTREESGAYFRTRPLGAKLSAWASAQSQVVPGREELEQRFQQFMQKYGEDVPLPPYWGGYRVEPETIEFWQGRFDRLHDRLCYRRPSDGTWIIERLAP